MKEILLTIADTGSKKNIGIGDSVKLVLEEVSTSGYVWEIDGELPEQLNMTQTEYSLKHGNTIGGSGNSILNLQAVEKGSAVLQLKYWQPWNGEASVENRFNISFIIE